MVDYPIQTQESGLGNSPSSFDPDHILEGKYGRFAEPYHL